MKEIECMNVTLHSWRFAWVLLLITHVVVYDNDLCGVNTR